MVGVEQSSRYQHRAIVVQEAGGKVIDPLPGELLDDDLPVSGKQVDGMRKNAVQILCVVQGTREQHDVIYAGDVVDIAVDGHHSTFHGGLDRFGIAINAGHLVAQIHQRSRQSAAAAAHFEDSGWRSWKQQLQMGKRMGHDNGCQIHSMSRPEESKRARRSVRGSARRPFPDVDQ